MGVASHVSAQFGVGKTGPVPRRGANAALSGGPRRSGASSPGRRRTKARTPESRAAGSGGSPEAERARVQSAEASLSAEASPSSTRDRIAALKLRSISVRQRRESPAASVRQSAPEWTASRSEEHTSELQSLMRISYAVFCLKKNNDTTLKKNEQAQK